MGQILLHWLNALLGLQNLNEGDVCDGCCGTELHSCRVEVQKLYHGLELPYGHILLHQPFNLLESQKTTLLHTGAGVSVGVGVKVAVGIIIAVGRGVRVGVGVFVGVGVGVLVAVGTTDG